MPRSFHRLVRLELAPRPSASQGRALFLAINDGVPARVMHLLEDGADSNARDERGEPALIYALHDQKFEAAEILIGARGIDLNAENSYGQTALIVAALEGKKALVTKLLGDDA